MTAVSPPREPATEPVADWRRPTALALSAGSLLVALVAGLLYTGAAAPFALQDPGPLVRWGLPIARAAQDVGGVIALGALLLAATAVPAGSRAFRRAAGVGAVAAAVWTVAATVALLLTFALSVGAPLTDPRIGEQLSAFLLDLELTRNLLIGVLLAAATATCAFGVRTPTGAGLTAALAAAAWFPVALTGHASGNADHETAVSGWWLHVLGVAVWLGGLVTLALLRGRLGTALPDVAARYSTLAGVGFVLVVVSGAVNGWLRLNAPSDLLDGYGLLLLLKVAGTLALGAAGWWHRRSTLRALTGPAADDATRGRPFWRLLGGELVLFGAVSGLAVALSRSDPPNPVDEAPPALTPAQVLTGEPLPPPFDAGRLLDVWRPDVLWVLVALGLAVAYAAGVRRLRARGDSWPLHRTLLWLLGCAALLWVTSGALAEYGRVLFSLHMVQHMALSMVVPPLLVFGAPVTLAMRALPRRRDGSKGPREWLTWAIETPWARFVSHPVVAAVVFAGSIVVFYFSPLFGLALSTHLGHELMMVHFLLAGYLFAQALVGVDPGPNRSGYPLRLVLLFATMAFHAFFGVTLVTGETLLEATWFSTLGWGYDALADQRTGGEIAWGIGEVPTILLAMVLVAQWVRSDDRETRRSDRAADRDDDAELKAYNAMLQRMGERSSGS
ncbi:cytochrome c oxidase assembly protein [Thalassiella azotivora]